MKYTLFFVLMYFINRLWLVEVLAQPKVNIDIVYNRLTEC